MFAIAVPSTLTLTTPVADGGDPVPFATLTFSHPTDDVSKCMVTITTADGDVHEATFNTNGQAVEQRFTSAQEIADAHKAQEAINEERAANDRAVAEEASKRELRTVDDTTEADVSWDAPHSTEIKQYPRDYDPNPQPAFVPAAPAGLKPADTEIPHG